MPKMTAKYSGALAAAHHCGLSARDTANQEELYDLLQQRGYFWGSKAKVWEYHEPEEANDPTPLIMVRVWADGEIAEEAADDITRKLKALNWQLIERSKPYACRPPKQREARIYLKFLPRS